jgi:hypothetical protein
MTAAERSGALLRQLDQSLQHDDLRHAPACDHPSVAHERGYSITVTRCLGCGAVSTIRNSPSTTKRKASK